VKVITVTNRKGGVGKSTMSTHIAAGLATRGYRVGLIDTDSQGHAGLMLNMPEENGLYNVLLGKATLEDSVREVPAHHYSLPDTPTKGALFLIPSSSQTYKIPFELIGLDEEEDKNGDVFAVMRMVDSFAELCQLDAIIIDTNPTLSLFDSYIYMASDAFIYVTECERLSFDGIRKAVGQITRLARNRKQFLKRDTEIIGIVPNKVRDTILHNENVQKLQQAYGDLVWEGIKHRIVWAEATNFNTPIFVYAPSSQATLQAWDMVNRIERALEWQTKGIE
jgi:chromosome partitioning protein